MLTKDIQHNVDVLTEVLGQAPPAARARARAVAKQIERLVVDLRREAPKDPATTLGITLSMCLLLNHIVENTNKAPAQSNDGNLIQLLS